MISFLKRSVLVTLVALGFLALMVLFWTVRAFDREQVRDAVRVQIAKATGLRTVLDEVGLQVRGGLAVWGRRLTLFDEDGQAVLTAPEIHARFNWIDVLRGNFDIRALTLDGLRLSLDLRTDTDGSATQGSGLESVLGALSSLDTLHLKDGRLDFASSAYHLERLQAEVHKTEHGSGIRFAGRARLWYRDSTVATLRGEGKVNHHGYGQASLQGRAFDLDAVQPLLHRIDPTLQLSGRTDFFLHTEGSQRNAAFRVTWQVSDLRAEWPSHLEDPFEAAVARGEFQGRWQPNAWTLQAVHLKAGPIVLEGKIQKTIQGVHGHVKSKAFAFERIIPLLGEGLIGSRLNTFFRSNVQQGEGTKTEFRFHWRPSDEEKGELDLLMTLDFREGVLRFDPSLPPLRRLRGRLNWRGDRVWFEDLQGAYQGHVFRSMAAEISEIGKTSTLTGNFALDLNASELLELFQRMSGAQIKAKTLQGSCSMDLTLSKSFLSKQPLRYEADVALHQVDMEIPGWLKSVKISAGTFKATPETFALSEVRGNVDGSDITLQGSIQDWSDKDPKVNLQGTGQLSQGFLRPLVIKLTGLDAVIAGVGTLKFDVSGVLRQPQIRFDGDLTDMGWNLDPYWRKLPREPLSLEAELHPTSPGVWKLEYARLTGDEGEIQGEGRLNLGQGQEQWLEIRSNHYPVDALVRQLPWLREWIHGGRLSFHGQVYLGRQWNGVFTLQPRHVHVSTGISGIYPEILSGRIVVTPQWSHFEALKMNSMQQLFSLEGKLRHDPQGLSFRGELESARVDLQPWLVAAKNGNSDGRARFAGIQKTISRLPKAELTFRFKEMVLGDRQSHNVQGRVITNDQKLSLSNVQGELAGGWVGMEAFLDSAGEFWLSGGISEGHAAQTLALLGFDEKIVEAPLFVEAGIAGRLGEDGATHYEGNVEVELERGILYKFPVLANILSILNVSQYFKGRLPDMSAEGMVFNKIRGSFLLEDGVATTENFQIFSEAMGFTMVGDFHLARKECDLKVGVQPFVALDRLVSSLPLLGYYLAGPDGNFLATYFLVQGALQDPDVKPIPLRSLGQGILGIFHRLFQNPFGDKRTIPPDRTSPPLSRPPEPSF